MSENRENHHPPKIKESLFYCHSKTHLHELIEKFPKFFHHIIQDFEKGNLDKKFIKVPGSDEQIKFETYKNKKIKVQFYQSNGKNFTSKFQSFVHEIYDEIDNEEHLEKIIGRKSLMDRSLNRNTIKKIEKSIKDYQFPL